jgi:hypothetical protein
MGQILHGSARTTEAVRRAIYSQESLRILACRQGVNPKTIASWRKRSSIADRRTGPYPRPPFFRLNRKPLSLLFAGIRCFGSTTAYGPRSRS